ncbi:unnamed protein product [Rotaria socialis]
MPRSYISNPDDHEGWDISERRAEYTFDLSKLQQEQSSLLLASEEAFNLNLKLTEKDLELIEEAKHVSRRLHRPHYHVVVSALRTCKPTDKIYTGIHIESSQPLCGEVSAICSMINDGRQMGELETIVALAGDDTNKDMFRLFSPCGRCRELIGDCNRKARVIVGTIEQPYVLSISKLMPLKWTDVENEYWARRAESD